MDRKTNIVSVKYVCGGKRNEKFMNTKIQRFNNLDGIRTLAAIGIILMHVKSNIGFEVAVGGKAGKFILEHLIGEMGGFVQLFFILSGFSMCCGYYQGFKEGHIDLNQFYSRRYRKIIPFFSFFLCFDLLATFLFNGAISIGIFYEAFADITLMFGFFPASDISVIGVGWTLGVIFGFYLLFPFFVYLIWNKKRAWFSFLITLGIHYVCSIYFLADGNAVGGNTARWLCFFVAGGLIYLYREEVFLFYSKMNGKAGTVLSVTMVLAGLLSALLINGFDISQLLSTILLITAYSIILLGAIGPETKIWYNRVSRYIGKISFEIYLSHMMVYRVIEKLRMTEIFEKTILSYFVTCFFTLGGVILFVSVYQILRKKLFIHFQV